MTQKPTVLLTLNLLDTGQISPGHALDAIYQIWRHETVIDLPQLQSLRITAKAWPWRIRRVRELLHGAWWLFWTGHASITMDREYTRIPVLREDSK